VKTHAGHLSQHIAAGCALCDVLMCSLLAPARWEVDGSSCPPPQGPFLLWLQGKILLWLGIQFFLFLFRMMKT